MTCNANSQGYGSCLAVSCDVGFNLVENHCVPIPVIPICEAGSPHDCSSDSTVGTQACNEAGSGYGECVFGDCKPGYSKVDNQCTLDSCDPGNKVSCPIDHGQGQSTCNTGGQSYGDCVVTTCNEGFQLNGNVCQPIPVPPVCEPGSHRSCDSEFALGTETCNEAGSGYNPCVYGKCKPGCHEEDQDDGKHDNKTIKVCKESVCEPREVTPCTAGAGYGFKVCDHYGAGFGVCSLVGCQPGYALRDGVCVHQVCQPGSESACEFSHGTGSKICKSSGMDYGSCALDSCNEGYAAIKGKCVEMVCQPGSQLACKGQSGSGVKTCTENGMGYGSCELTACDETFRLREGQCVGADYCDSGEKRSCSCSNGGGHRFCDEKSHRIGSCVAEQCDNGFELFGQGDSKACKKKK